VATPRGPLPNDIGEPQPPVSTMPVVLITGANRGIGLEFVRQYAAEGWRVHACCRAPKTATALEEIQGEIVIHRLDVGEESQREALKTGLAKEAIDLLINNAGLMGPRRQPIERISDEDWLEVVRINAIAPVRIADALADSVAKSRMRVIAFITSGLASLANAGPGDVVYRMSKTALNMGMRCLCADLHKRGIMCVALAPGWVRTDMGGASAPVAPATSIRGMRAVIAKLGPGDTGRYLDYQGKRVPW
jgi:NAD(P)-dependent dehydrogenase (short-subunit alcohol dehydrogenase family)